MQHVQRDEAPMLNHTVDVMNDRMANDCTGYSDPDTRAVLHLDVMAKTETSQLIVDGSELGPTASAKMMSQIVESELSNWVPDASQRLLVRAAAALGVTVPVTMPKNPDCGAEPGWHALTSDWVAGIFVRKCVTCQRLFRDGTPS